MFAFLDKTNLFGMGFVFNSETEKGSPFHLKETKIRQNLCQDPSS